MKKFNAMLWALLLSLPLTACDLPKYEYHTKHVSAPILEKIYEGAISDSSGIGISTSGSLVFTGGSPGRSEGFYFIVADVCPVPEGKYKKVRTTVEHYAELHEGDHVSFVCKWRTKKEEINAIEETNRTYTF